MTDQSHSISARALAPQAIDTEIGSRQPRLEPASENLHRLNPDVASLPENPFAALAALLADVRPPAATVPLNAAVGDPQGQCPVPLAVLAEHGHLWGRYPPLDGTDELRGAIAGWLNRRNGLDEAWTRKSISILPVAGTREALFLAATLAVGRSGAAREKVLVPDPCYPGYLGAAVMAGGDPIPVPARAADGYLPDFEALGAELLSRTAILYFTNPTNPEGAAAPRSYLKRLLELSEQYGFILAVDECCIDLYTRERPLGILTVCREGGFSTERLLVFNSLSKRSLSAGLRSGFVAGGPALMARMRTVRSYTGATVPLPIQAASAALWADDGHVDAIRAELDAKFTLVEEAIGSIWPAARPTAGFFLWLAVEDDLALTRRLWSAGLRVMPGSLLGRGWFADNPGQGRIRVALVHSPAETVRLLEILTRTLGT
jgi:aspartate/methionine/tyrosine aminotransferase